MSYIIKMYFLVPFWTTYIFAKQHHDVNTVDLCISKDQHVINMFLNES